MDSVDHEYVDCPVLSSWTKCSSHHTVEVQLVLLQVFIEGRICINILLHHSSMVWSILKQGHHFVLCFLVERFADLSVQFPLHDDTKNLPRMNPISDPSANIPDSVKMYSVPDSCIYVPKAPYKAISKWKFPRRISRLSKSGASRDCIE